MTDGTGATPAGSGRNALLEQATAAAAAGDPAAMLEALHNAGVLDGIARYIAARWSDFDFEDATLFVAAAVDRLYAKIRAGEHVRNVSAFLFKVALNKATDAYVDAVVKKIQADYAALEKAIRDFEQKNGRWPLNATAQQVIQPLLDKGAIKQGEARLPRGALTARAARRQGAGVGAEFLTGVGARKHPARNGVRP